MSANGAPCQMCGQWIAPNMPHFCQWAIPAYPAPQPPPQYPVYQPTITWPPPAALTLDDIRKVVREEIERRFPPQTPDSASPEHTGEPK